MMAHAFVPEAATPAPARALAVRPALLRFQDEIDARLRDAAADDERTIRRRAVRAILRRALADEAVDTVDAFERVLNRCLDVGYRAEPLAAFVFEVLGPRLTARARRRLLPAGAGPEDVADVVSTAAVAIQRLLREGRREQHSLRYALLLSIADHRAIDHLRRRRPERRESLDESTVGEVSAPWLSTAFVGPDRALERRERVALAHRLRDAVFAAANALPDRERAALILVEIDGVTYDEVADRLGISRSDVGNVLRRARLLRDRAFTPLLRDLPGANGHLGFGELRADKSLRLNLLAWSAEIGDGPCPTCLALRRHLHAAEAAC
jgi:RNA polymerase sigma-70 factor (ECF subfamily)